ncbi:hypothetical protein KRR55_17235 [Paeniglutamicibacter sp. ABSL32-1]|uniref:hypothetical protein n=1 Tax=Paeniglutamicibacter quisquiliarum TaxID=2849498 RepID=UPI001C2D6193|nr:hypothetical protein [Paeniglutamicibacter quisquiliarum]MBV1780860.1 hypothetical protein [Paeniglutamicibacter quisquiliarum]
MDTAGIMHEFAGYLEKERLPEAARAYDEFARELEAGVSRDRLAEICREVLESLRAGPMTISDRPVTNADGSVNAEATNRFNALIEDLRKFARGHVRGTRRFRWWGGSRG